MDAELQESLFDKLACLMDEDEMVASAMAETNGCAYAIDTIERGEAVNLFRVKFYAAEQREDRCFCGDTVIVEVRVEGTFDPHTYEWEDFEYEVLSAEVEDWSD